MRTPLAQDQRAGALRAAELVAGHGEQIRAERRHIDRHAAGRLHGVDVQQAAGAHERCRRVRAPAERRRSRCWRASAKPAAARPWQARCSALARSMTPSAVTGSSVDLAEPPAGAHRGVLDRGDEQRRARRALAIGLERRRQRQHVGLGRAGGENHLGRFARRRVPRPAPAPSRPARARRGLRHAPRRHCRSRSSAASIASRASAPQRRGGVPVEIGASVTIHLRSRRGR